MPTHSAIAPLRKLGLRRSFTHGARSDAIHRRSYSNRLPEAGGTCCAESRLHICAERSPDRASIPALRHAKRGTGAVELNLCLESFDQSFVGLRLRRIHGALGSLDRIREAPRFRICGGKRAED